MTILQVLPEAVSSTIMENLGDQLLCIILLISGMVYCVKKINALEKKLDEYVKNDREKMLMVIDNNTRALEHFDKRH